MDLDSIGTVITAISGGLLTGVGGMYLQLRKDKREDKAADGASSHEIIRIFEGNLMQQWMNTQAELRETRTYHLDEMRIIRAELVECRAGHREETNKRIEMMIQQMQFMQGGKLPFKQGEEPLFQQGDTDATNHA